MSDLRDMVGRELGKYLDDSRGGDQVLITASEGEAVFVTMLGLDLVPGGRVSGEKGLHHQKLFDWLGIDVCGAEDMGISIAYRELRGGANMGSSSGRFETYRPSCILCLVGLQRPEGSHWVSNRRAGYLPVMIL